LLAPPTEVAGVRSTGPSASFAPRTEVPDTHAADSPTSHPSGVETLNVRSACAPLHLRLGSKPEPPASLATCPLTEGTEVRSTRVAGLPTRSPPDRSPPGLPPLALALRSSGLSPKPLRSCERRGDFSDQGRFTLPVGCPPSTDATDRSLLRLSAGAPAPRSNRTEVRSSRFAAAPAPPPLRTEVRLVDSVGIDPLPGCEGPKSSSPVPPAGACLPRLGPKPPSLVVRPVPASPSWRQAPGHTPCRWHPTAVCPRFVAGQR